MIKMILFCLLVFVLLFVCYTTWAKASKANKKTFLRFAVKAGVVGLVTWLVLFFVVVLF